MNKTKKRSFTALLLVLASLFVLVLSLGIFCACGDTNETAAEESTGGSWYYGDEVPPADLGKNGDHYLNTETLTAYLKTADGTWQSTTLYSGAEAPDNAEGEAGDLYLDTKSGVLYQKGESLWSIVVTLKGEKGRDGVMWFSGETDPETGDPALTDAQKGDFYLNTKDFTVWQLQEKQDKSLGWARLGSIKPEDGATGQTGPAGPEGPRGPEGPEGPKGDDGKSAYELYVEQYKKDHVGAEEGWMSEEQWLESLKGEQGEPGKDSVHFFNGDGAPQDNPAVAGAVAGDLYVGRFDGTDGTGKGSGSILYRYDGKKWDVLMESMTKGTISIFSLEKLVEFSGLVAAGKIADGAEVHLKADIDFNEAATVSVKARAAVMAIAAADWTPIGTEEHPFKGTFDGEGHTISNFAAEAQAGDVAGFFGKVDGATIENLHFENATVTATGTGAYGAVVVGEAKSDVTLHNVTVSGKVTATDDGAKVGSLVGKNDGGTVTTKDVEVTVSGIENTKDNFVGEGTGATVEGNYATGSEVGEGFIKKEEYSSTGEVTSTSYEVLNKEGLIAFANSVNGTEEGAKEYYGEKITLADDIDLTGVNWTPIGSYAHKFRGSFDGQGHTISNLKIVRDDHAAAASYYGLFGYVGLNQINYPGKNENTIRSVIENLTLKNVDIPAASNPTEEKPHGDVASLSQVGAFAGAAFGANLKNLTLTGDVNISGQYNVGGIAGAFWMLRDRTYLKEDTVVENITVDAKGTISTTSGGCSAVFGAVIRSQATGYSGNHNFLISNIVVKNVTLKGASGVGGVIGIASSPGLKDTALTIDGVTMTDVTIIGVPTSTANTTSFGVIMGADAYGENQTVTFKNLSGTVSVESNGTKQAEALHKGVIGKTIEGLDPTIESNTLEITWNGEPLAAE